MTDATKTTKYKKRHKALDSEFSSWKSDGQTISDFILPRRGRFLSSDVNKGGKTNNKIINNSGTYALRTLSAGMMAGLTSPARPWFRLSTDTKLMENTAVKSWLFDVQKILLTIFAKSNLYKSLPVLYTELGGFGTGCMVIDEDFDDVIRCTTHTYGSYRLATNKKGVADTMYRDDPMTVQQVVDKFGFKNCSESVQGLYKSEAFDKYVDVVHVIEPRTVRDHNLATPDQMPIASIWYEKGSTEDKFLRNSGYEETSLVAPRWIADGSDVYGTGPGHDTKGEIKALQIKEKEKAKAIAKMSNPPMTGPSSMKDSPASVLPGHITFVDSRQGQEGFRPAYQIQARVAELNGDINESERRISRGFYEDLFLMLTQSDRRQITATEVAEKKEEKLLVLGPVVERVEDEGLDIIIDRTFNIANRNGLIPPPPEELQGKKLKVEYISILAQAQKSVSTTGIERLVDFITIAAQGQAAIGEQPTVLDKLDFDQAVDEYSDSIGVSPKIVRSDEDVEEMREIRNQAAIAKQTADSIAQSAAVGKDLSATDTEGKNALTDIINAG